MFPSLRKGKGSIKKIENFMWREGGTHCCSKGLCLPREKKTATSTDERGHQSKETQFARKRWSPLWGGIFRGWGSL